VLVASERIEIPEQASIMRNVEPAFTQHAKATERCDVV
jgi:hypothetical protein